MSEDSLQETKPAAVLSEADQMVEEGHRLARLQRMDEAIAAYRQATRIDPELARAHQSLGEALYTQSRLEEAVPELFRTIELEPGNMTAMLTLGVVMHRSGNLRGAVNAYHRAIQLKPDLAEAFTNLGIVYQDMRDWQKGASMQAHALKLNPKLVSAHNNLGVCLFRMNRYAEALKCFFVALQINPNHSGAHFNIGHLFEQMGFPEASEKYYQHALDLDPQSPTLRFYLGGLHLLQGRYEQGWMEYEARWNTRHLYAASRSWAQPQWHGEPLNGENILIHAEQGLGDTLQFVRYLPMVQQRGGRIIFEVQEALKPVLAEMPGFEEITLVVRDQPTPEYRWQCALLSLPYAFGTTVETIPAPIPYLFAPPSKAADWAAKLPTADLRVGIVWAGNPKHMRDAERSMPLRIMAGIAGVDGVDLYSLQKGEATAQLRDLPEDVRIVDLDPEQANFSDTAAIIANLDLVIAVDTSVAHLAGGMGKAVWILLHQASDWRWLLHRQDTPWYPTARLFRKAHKESWEGLIARVRFELQEAVRRVREARSALHPQS